MESIPVSPFLAEMARRFDIDLASLADEAVRDRMLRDPVRALTPRMQAILLAAHHEARGLGHPHIGTEHIFLAVVLDHASIPSQVLEEMGVVHDVVHRIRALLRSEGYHRGISGAENGSTER